MGRKLYVEILSAHNLMPKDGHGSANPYCIIDFDGQRRKTKVKLKDLNPVWNEKFEFPVSDPVNMGMESLDIWVHSEKKNATSGRDSFLGKVRIPGSSFVKHGEEAITHHPLERKNLFSTVKGELRIKVYYVDESSGVSGKAKDHEKIKDHDKHHHHHGKEDNVILKKEEKIKEDHGHGKKMVAPTTMLPPGDFALKDTSPVLGHAGEKHTTYDLVEKMHYLYVRVVKARDLAVKDMGGSSDPYVKVKVGEGYPAKTEICKRTVNPVWNQVFAFGKDKIQGPTVEITVWDADKVTKDDFLGFVQFELAEISKRVPPESPLAPQWYKLESGRKGDTNVKGEIMVAVWWGTQADEAFSESWQSDSGGHYHNKAKVYLSPKLWYLRVNVIEAQDLVTSDKNRIPEVSVRCQLGATQVYKTKVSSNRTNSPFWNQDLVFVAAEPFEEHLILTVEDRVGPNKEEVLGVVKIPLKEIDRRIDHRNVNSRWFNLEKNGDKPFRGRMHLRICFDGGYHVMDESTNHISDSRPTAKQLWKHPMGVLELGILSAKGLVPIKTREGRGTTDAYCVAKYGQKWVRTRTTMDSFSPRWHEQYTWEVYDPCTVLTIGVFDNNHTKDEPSEKVSGARDSAIGKVRIRVSTLESDRVYTNSYPLLVLQRNGVKKMGELELAVRFSCTSVLNMMHIYFTPPLPKMHYLHPLGVIELEHLRTAAIRIVSSRLARSEPPLRHEVVHYMLDTDSNMFSMRRSKVNYYRMLGILSGAIAVTKWFNDICQWKNPLTTVLVHILFLILVWYPELILPTLFLYMFLIGAWHYRFRPRSPPYMDARLSQAEHVDHDELDEEFDTFPTSKTPDVVKHRYERLRVVASRIQSVLGDLASQGERLNALLSWRDPRATAIFITFCLVAAILLYVIPFRVVAVLIGLYALRHPRFRNRVPPVPMNFFRRLPSYADRIL